MPAAKLSLTRDTTQNAVIRDLEDDLARLNAVIEECNAELQASISQSGPILDVNQIEEYNAKYVLDYSVAVNDDLGFDSKQYYVAGNKKSAIKQCTKSTNFPILNDSTKRTKRWSTEWRRRSLSSESARVDLVMMSK
jgi:hypothetical protein